MGSALSEKDVNAPVQVQDTTVKDTTSKTTSAMSLEFHRQKLQSKMEEEKYGATAITTTTTAVVTKPAIAVTKPTSATRSNTSTLTGACVAPTTTIPPCARAPQHPNKYLVANMDSAPGRDHKYVSPSDNIMSPCSAKLSALKSRAASRAKPKSLFAQTSAKKFEGENIFGTKKTLPSPSPSPSPTPSDGKNNNPHQQSGN
ncbi:uncharacterized protein GGS25DRAFT_268824 [Hypoxylon fragiforme]|uniref:uncharacterized protein n=1 Tax=Hypoxylon fragiforme TaxID=63214 RepID=UPI0020C6D9CE|nr:uncharacterized protein GGS25DRAFT_268824 [Hypoxylon fragiforme]KAI2608290.1 hypothetical protein GGS25DRAFT_268824 [Hypoxylon fragiforme]